MNLNNASQIKLRGVHPDLVRVVRRCAADWGDKDTGFIVTCGVRTLEEQKVLLAKKATRTLNSRHIPKNGFSHAVDLAPVVQGQVRWDWPLFLKLADAMKRAASAKAENVPIRWGGSWTLLSSLRSPITASALSKSFPDGPHFELPRDLYP